MTSTLGRWAVALALLAGPAAALSRGEAGADFLKIGNGVRAVAMGGSYTAIGEDIYSVYWNPAGTANLTAPESAFSYVKLYQSQQIAGVYLLTGAVEFPGEPFGFGNGGAGFMALTTGSFDSTDPQALVRAAAGDASDRALPIPTDCEPWPGKTNANRSMSLCMVSSDR